MKHLAKWLASCWVCAAAYPALLPAVDRFVALGGGNVAPYTNWAGAATSIQAAIDASSSGDCIWVSNGTYVSSGPATNASMLYIDKAITLRSWSGAAATIIDGGYPLVTNRCLWISNASAVVEGFTIRNGCASGGPPSGFGGGVYVAVGGTIRNCLIAGNRADSAGGGVYFAISGALVNCTIVTNIAGGTGGGLAVGSNATVRNCIVYFNSGSPANWHTNLTASISYTCASPLPPGTGNTDSDPQLASISSTNVHLSAGSPCINTGLSESWMYSSCDLDGQERVMRQRVDIGVDEYTRVWYVAPAPAGSDTYPGSASFPWATIQYAVTNASVGHDDMILVAGGEYVENIIFPSTGPTGLVVRGGYRASDWAWSPADCPTVIRAANSANHVITLSSPSHTLASLVIGGGNCGIYNGISMNTRFGVYECAVTNNSSHGILINGTKCALSARNCLIAGNGGDGIRFVVDNSPYGSPIYNCTIAGNGGDGIFMNYLTVGVDVRNCIITGNGGYGLRQNPVNSHNLMTVAYSDIYGNALGAMCTRVADDKINVSTGVVSCVPQFVASGDYCLSASSACVDRGEDLSLAGVTMDIQGKRRLGAFDQGCCESDYSAPARLAQVYVDAAASDDLGDGSSWATAKKTIGSGLAAAATGGTCYVAGGTYDEQIFMPGSVTLAGTNRNAVIVSCTGTFHNVTIAENDSVVRGISTRGGNRGIDITGDRARVSDCILSGHAYGVGHISQRAVVENCLITSNSTCGVRVWFGGVGGFAGLSLFNCLVAGNAQAGEHVERDNGGNNWFHVLACTIVSNGLHGYRYHGYNCQTYITNTILAHNGGFATYFTGWGGSQKPTIDYSCVYGNSSGTCYTAAGLVPPVIGPNVMSSDPLFAGPPADWSLAAGSPCIGAGLDLSAGWNITNDVNGTLRTNAYDIGCYESAYAPPARYDAVYVDAGRPDDSGAGTNWATAKKTIGAGLSIVSSSGTCWLAAGAYSENVSMPSFVTLSGTNRQSTIISAANSTVAMSGSNALLRSVTVTGGTRGVWMSGRANRVRDCIVRNNSESGIYITAQDNAVEDSILANNQYGLYAPSWGGQYILDRCVVCSNSSHGVYQYGGNPTSPGGLLRNCLIFRNGGDGFSSWTDNGPTNTFLYNCTIVSNAGNGVYDNYLTRYPFAINCVIAGNGQYGIRQANNGHYAFVVRTCNVFGNAMGNFSHFQANGQITLYEGNISADPCFAGADSWRLASNSPCIGWGADLSASGVTDDIEKNPRSGVFDMGCYQSGYPQAAKYAEVFVDANRPDDSGSATNWASAKRTIGSGLAVTATGGICRVAEGAYSDTIILPRLVTVEGAGHGVSVTSSWYVAACPETNSCIRGLQLSGGIYGVFASGSGHVVEQCSIFSNYVGVYFTVPIYSGSRLTALRSLIVSNSTHGIYASQGVLTLENCLIAANGGDGVQQYSDNAGRSTYLVHCTVADNGSDGYEHTHNLQYPVYVTNSIFTRNAGYGYKRTSGASYGHAIAYSCVSGNGTGETYGPNITLGSGIITNQSPALASGSYQLSEASPCVDSGTDAGVSVDAAGRPRPIVGRKPLAGSGFDMGCYELVPRVKGSVFVMR